MHESINFNVKPEGKPPHKTHIASEFIKFKPGLLFLHFWCLRLLIKINFLSTQVTNLLIMIHFILLHNCHFYHNGPKVAVNLFCFLFVIVFASFFYQPKTILGYNFTINPTGFAMNFFKQVINLQAFK